MVDPKHITDYNRSPRDLEEFAIFSVCVAGKNAHNTAEAVDFMLDVLAISTGKDLPMSNLYNYVNTQGIESLQETMKHCGIGCHTGTEKIPGRAEVCYNLAKKVLEHIFFLATCSPADLEQIDGIGSKTSRFFILHSRPNVRIAALDRHILHWLNDNGVKAPKQPPPKGSKQYARLESIFLDMCDKAGKGYAEMDLEIWNKYALDGSANRGRLLLKRSDNEPAKHETAVAESQPRVD